MARRIAAWQILLALAAGLVVPRAAPAQQFGKGELKLTVVDRDTGKPVACRVHLHNAKGLPHKPPGLPFWKDHFVCDGAVTLTLPRGEYAFEMERGPEYTVRYGRFSIGDYAVDEKTVDLHRVANPAETGWWSGEFHVHRPLDQIELLMRAEDLHVAPVITWWNKKSEWTGKPLPEKLTVQFDENRFYNVMGGEDERGGGALLFFNLSKPLAIADAAREYPPAIKFLAEARQQPDAWIDVEKPFWQDVPVWLASGMVDSIGIANNHMQRSGMLANEAWGRARDPQLYRGPLGNGRWTQDIYYHALNCGLRIPPSAGSASGVLANPVGYNRAYVYLGDEPLSYEAWWQAYREGRVFVTNGPIMEPFANGEPPGHVFRAEAGEAVELDVMLRNFTTREKVSYLELVRDGQVIQSVRLQDWAKTGHFAPVVFQRSGWLLVRVVTDVQQTYRFASSGPWYVEVGPQRQHISRTSVKFFLGWLSRRAEELKLDDPQQRAEVLATYAEARRTWEKLLFAATAD